ncbi:MAG: hypothetical protein LBE59_12675, partial [Nevskiaceae bacterium]|nr:hypothetical protein [Nevskiaceae bacterium]
AAQQIVRSDAAAADRTVDLILNPRPGNALCWDALRLTREADTMRAERAVVALPAGAPTCGSDAPLEWTTVASLSIPELARLSAQNCSVRAWLQFGRAPSIEEGVIGDLRFSQSVRGGDFTAMRIDEYEGEACPPYLTNWTPPRSDLLGDGAGGASSAPTQ